MGSFVDRCMFLAASNGSGSFVVGSAVTGYMTPAQAGALNNTQYSYAAELRDSSGNILAWEVGAGTYTIGNVTLTRTPAFSSNSNALVNFASPPNVMLTPLAADLSGTVSAGTIIVSNTEPANPQAGQVWFNPTTQLLSVAGAPPSYAWSTDLLAGPVVLSNSNLTAKNIAAAFPNIVAPSSIAGVKSASILPSVQKYVFAVTTAFTVVDGSPGFGLGDDAQTLGNGLFLGFPGPPSPGIGYYPFTTGFYYFVNNAIPGGINGSSNTGSYPNGVYYVAIDPVAQLMWVQPTGQPWNNSVSANPATGVGGIGFPFDVTTSRIIGQVYRNNDQITVDPTASGLSVPTGFVPLSQIVAWEPLTYINPSAISGGWVNIKDFGAIGDGVGEDGEAFQQFTKAYQGKDVILYVPPGSYQSGSNTLGLWQGISQLTIIGYGASFTPSISQYGGVTNTYTSATSALVQTCGVGDTQLTLVSGGDASKFTTGDWVMLGALDIQGAGLPPNMQFVEFVQIQSVSGSTVFLNNPLKGGPYLSTYPYYTSNEFGVNEGGPATIWKMFAGWDADVYVYGVNFLDKCDMPFVRQKYYRDCQWPGFTAPNYPVNVSQAKAITFENCRIQGNADIEIDKDIERLTFRNCDITGYFNTLLFSSASVQQLIIDGCNIGTLQGTPKNTYITNSWINSLIPTPRSNGVMESLFVENSYIGFISETGWGSGFGGAELISSYSFSNGTFSKANSGFASFVPWACPGAKCIFQNGDDFYRSPPSFTVLAVRSDMPGVPGAGNIFIDTTLPAALPTWAQGAWGGSNPLPTKLVQHPYGKVSFKNCHGDQFVEYWQDGQNPYRDAGSGWQYARLLLIGNTTPAVGSNMHVEGTFVSIKINVLRAYSGANGSEHLVCSAFQGYDASFTGVIWDTSTSINVKTAGLRSWSAGAWTGSVAGDTLPTITVGSWVLTYPIWSFDFDMSGDNLAQTPIVSIEIVTDVGIIQYSYIDFGNTKVVS